MCRFNITDDRGWADFEKNLAAGLDLIASRQPVNASAPLSVSFNEYCPGDDPEHKANLIRDELRAGTMTPARATALLEDGGFTMKQIEDLFAEAGKR